MLKGHAAGKGSMPTNYTLDPDKEFSFISYYSANHAAFGFPGYNNGFAPKGDLLVYYHFYYFYCYCYYSFCLLNTNSIPI